MKGNHYEISYFRKPGNRRSNNGNITLHGSKSRARTSHDVILFLWNEAVTLARPGIGDHVTGVNLPPLKDVLAAIQAAGIPIWVCGACAAARKVEEADLISGAVIKAMGDYIEAVAERERCVAF